MYNMAGIPFGIPAIKTIEIMDKKKYVSPAVEAVVVCMENNVMLDVSNTTAGGDQALSGRPNGNWF